MLQIIKTCNAFTKKTECDKNTICNWLDVKKCKPKDDFNYCCGFDGKYNDRCEILKTKDICMKFNVEGASPRCKWVNKDKQCNKEVCCGFDGKYNATCESFNDKDRCMALNKEGVEPRCNWIDADKCIRGGCCGNSFVGSQECRKLTTQPFCNAVKNCKWSENIHECNPNPYTQCCGKNFLREDNL